MAVGRYIAHRKLADGSYEDVYTKSESGLIYRPNGRTVEQDLAAYLPEYQNSDNVPKSLTSGKLIIHDGRVFIGGKNNTVMEVLLMGQEISISNISKISGLTAEEILDKMVEKKIGIAGSGSGVTKTDYSDIMTGTPTLGANVTIGGYEWTVCHIDYDGGIMYLIKTYVEEDVQFGSSVNYKGSTIANKCATFQAKLPKTVTDKLLDISVFGVTSKVFIPKASWVGPAIDFTNNTITDSTAGYFSYFNTNGARVAYDKSGTTKWYWTSSPSSSSVWGVNDSGNLSDYGVGPSSTLGFRPCLALAL